MAETLGSTLSTGLRTTDEFEQVPGGFRVSWINWDSGFRGSGLRVGDRIIAIAGSAAVAPTGNGRAIGQPMEAQLLESLGLRGDGAPLTLTVRRGREQLEITGKVRVERWFTDAANAGLIDRDGPPRFARDGFDASWSGWYDTLWQSLSRVLDGGWRNRSFYSRLLLTQCLAERPRVEYLGAHYPGAFADAVRADWQEAITSLEGRRYQLSAADLAWRSLGEQRLEEVTHAGRAAREAFLASLAGQTITPFPAVDPIRGDRASVAGKVVVLPRVLPRDWVSEPGVTWYAKGSRTDGYYFIDPRTPVA